MNLNKAVEQTLKMLESALPKMVAIETRLAADLCTIDADPTQMEQMVMNLATNAADAMAEGGRLVMETGRETILAEQCLTCGKTFSGEFALLRVSDNGLGIAEDDLQRIFEPFFTTKGLGQGTGLGLATVYGVVKGHGGHIQCQSRVGEGTTFTVYLPCQQIASQGPAARDTAADKPAGGSETVLLVDDEEPLRALGQRTLKGAGYRVLTAPSGEKALELYKEAGSGIDLVVLDLSMPGMGGLKCLKEMMALNPALRVVIASGYAEEGQVGQSLEAGAAGFVAKPFSRAQLLNAVREALDRRA
jgi:CheY-like chemotaxis protein